MNITLFLPDFHGHAQTLPYFRPPHWVLPFSRHPPWILPYFVAFQTASKDITLFYPISDRSHGHYPSSPYFRPPPWILPCFTFFPTASLDITLLSSRTCIARAHSLLADHSLPHVTVSDSDPSLDPGHRAGQSQQTASLHSRANRTATVNV